MDSSLSRKLEGKREKGSGGWGCGRGEGDGGERAGAGQAAGNQKQKHGLFFIRRFNDSFLLEARAEVSV